MAKITKRKTAKKVTKSKATKKVTKPKTAKKITKSKVIKKVTSSKSNNNNLQNLNREFSELKHIYKK
ncbi:hypothetical protein OAK17_04630 [Alphaproteobacteria bacterium]|nr:hypothetical protein [Alphaproteobacteria bacterium]